MWQTILTGIAVSMLKDAAHLAWEILWQVIGDAMLEAEKKWIEKGAGLLKKDWVMEQAMGYVTKNMKLNFITKWIVQSFISRVVDQLVFELNKDFENHEWVKHVKGMREYIEKFLPTFLR